MAESERDDAKEAEKRIREQMEESCFRVKGTIAYIGIVIIVFLQQLCYYSLSSAGSPHAPSRGDQWFEEGLSDCDSTLNSKPLLAKLLGREKP